MKGCWQEGFLLRHTDVMEMGSTGKPVSRWKNNFNFLFSSVTIWNPRVTRGPGSLSLSVFHSGQTLPVSHSINMKCCRGWLAWLFRNSHLLVFIFMIIPLVSFSSSLLIPGFKVSPGFLGEEQVSFLAVALSCFYFCLSFPTPGPRVFF